MRDLSIEEIKTAADPVAACSRNCEEENCFNSDLADFAGITQAG